MAVIISPGSWRGYHTQNWIWPINDHYLDSHLSTPRYRSKDVFLFSRLLEFGASDRTHHAILDLIPKASNNRKIVLSEEIHYLKQTWSPIVQK
jgi:hypothetical protein